MIMGKQINYYMEYKTFCKVAERALELGAVIVKLDSNGKIVHSTELSFITPDCRRYVFLFPQLGSNLVIQEISDRPQKLIGFGTPNGNALIEASFSSCEGRTVKLARLYTQSGYYSNGEWFARTPEMTAVFEKLVRLVKKYTKYTAVGTKTYKEYITPYYLDLVEKGDFEISQF